MAEKNRYFIELSFDGTPFHGWQVQPNAVSVQEKLNLALSTVLREQVETLGCGRTDTGVHARQFYAHFDTGAENSFTDHQLLNSLNSILPPEIAIRRIIPVSSDAHARFDATLRSYEYHVHFLKDPFKQHQSWFLKDKPDVKRMNEAARIIQDYTDFSCFSKSNTQVFTNNCRVSEALWTDRGETMVFRISADRFLRNMVRAIVGTLLSIGRAEAEPGSIRQVIESKDRSNAGTSVPACGLYLTNVVYPYLNNN